MSRLAAAYAKVSPRLAGSAGAIAAAKAHAWLYKRSGGRLGRTLVGIDVLVLRTTGRRSGQPREAPLGYVRDGKAFAVVASNAAAEATPAWWLNLQADPDAVVVLDGKEHPVHARRATDEEVARVWPKLQAMYVGFDHYKAIATREMPVVMLDPPNVLVD